MRWLHGDAQTVDVLEGKLLDVGCVGANYAYAENDLEHVIDRQGMHALVARAPQQVGRLLDPVRQVLGHDRDERCPLRLPQEVTQPELGRNSMDGVRALRCGHLVGKALQTFAGDHEHVAGLGRHRPPAREGGAGGAGPHSLSVLSTHERDFDGPLARFERALCALAPGSSSDRVRRRSDSAALSNSTERGGAVRKEEAAWAAAGRSSGAGLLDQAMDQLLRRPIPGRTQSLVSGCSACAAARRWSSAPK